MLLRLMFYFIPVVLCVHAVWAKDCQENEHREKVLEDIEVFETKAFNLDNSYSAQARKKAAALLEELKNRAAKISYAQLELELAQILALADNGHTLLLNPRWTRVRNRIPMWFMIADNRLYVAQSDDDEKLIGAEVLSVGGHSFPALEKAWANYQGGEFGWRRQFVYFFIESPEMLHAAGLIADPNQVELVLQTSRGKTRQVVKAVTDPRPMVGIEMYMPPARALWLERFKPKDSDQPIPSYLKDPQKLFAYEFLQSDQVGLLMMRSNTSSDTENMDEFLATTLEHLRGNPPSGIVLDFRHNPGGNLFKTREFMQKLPSLVRDQGKIVALVSGRTFSAAISSLGYLKQAGGEQVILVGEPIGDRLEFWAEGGLVQLPNSRAAVLISKQRHNYKLGEHQEDCFEGIQTHPIHVDHLEPDYPVSLTWKDYQNRSDPLLKTAIRIIQETTSDTATPYQIETVAGNGRGDFGGDGGPAIDAMLHNPPGVAVDENGVLFIADYKNHRIRRVANDGTITTIAGSGVPGFSGDNGKAKNAQLQGPYNVQIGPDQCLYIADALNGRIRKVSREGTMTTIAGGGSHLGDGGPATQARLGHPVDVAWDSKGRLYIAEGGGNRVRRVDTDGIITTFAGTGKSGFSGEGETATHAELNVPGALAIDDQDQVYIADLRNHRIRLVDNDGLITTIVGTGSPRFNGDHLAGPETNINQPAGLACHPDGSLIFTDGVNFRVRRLTASGRVETIAGNGQRGYSGESQDATQVKLGILDILTLDSDGAIYFSDYGNHRIRRLTPTK